eukprot:TRINITY_DN7985_c0_g1_i4.p1 TRINITY_DN7985_c0_g1~~TRINITY_DN7985_c0_g1_i4.p1  ORF type:complete len:184 (+),score=19.10 TRINITY_DN7985_c0_g1_i4:319-870(+)
MASLSCNLPILSLSMFLIVFSVCARDFSIVGYSQDDLTSQDKLIELFESWLSKHSKSYSSIEEKFHRFEIFKDNLKHIDDTNKLMRNYWLGLNEFADMSHEEFKDKYLGLKPDLSKRRESSKCHENFRYRDDVNIPKTVDWRKKGAVTHVKNQGSCGMFYYLPLSLSLYIYIYISFSFSLSSI